MRLEHRFEVPAPPGYVWGYMMDVERVAPCMPGAELTEIIDDRTWKGKVNVRLGPVSLAFAGTVVRQEVDEDARRAVLKANGRETKGKGTASAVVTSTLVPTGSGGTRIDIITDLTISGAVAQYGRGMIADVSQRLTDQFAECLAKGLQAPTSAPGPGRSKPVGGLTLGLWASLRAVGRFLARAWRAITSPRGRR